MNTALSFLDQQTTKEGHIGIAMAGSVLITALIMVATIRWAASDAGYVSLLVSLGVAGVSSVSLCMALWLSPGNQQPQLRSTAHEPPQTA